jgi:hypothetical protein
MGKCPDFYRIKEMPFQAVLSGVESTGFCLPLSLQGLGGSKAHTGLPLRGLEKCLDPFRGTVRVAAVLSPAAD